MNDSVERTLVDWLSEGPDRGPQHGLERALAATRRTSQRPGWTFPARWLPTELTMRPAVPRRAAYLFLIAALIASIAGAAALWVGSQRRTAPPFGPAGNGTILLEVGGRLQAFDPDGSDPRPVEFGLGQVTGPAYSPDGSQLAFFARAGDDGPGSVLVSNADGSDAVNITGDLAVVTPPLSSVAWSPDGSRVAFSSYDKSRQRLYVAATDGSGVSVISDLGADRTFPAWSPDGNWLAYRVEAAADSVLSTHLAIMRPDGSDERRLVSVPRSDASFSGSSWSPDSQRVAYFRSDDLEHVVAVVDLDGTETVVSRPGEDAANPVWSSDGERLAYSRGGLGGAVVVDLRGGSRVQIPPGPADCGVMWAPDGTALVGLGGPDCAGLYRIPLDDPTAATRLPIPSGGVGTTTWQRVAP